MTKRDLKISERIADRSVHSLFDLSGRIAVITGGGGLLGGQHAEAIAEMGGTPVLVDIDAALAEKTAVRITARYGVPAIGLSCDITQSESILTLVRQINDRFGRIDVLINNAAHNPTQEQLSAQNGPGSRLEKFSLARWNQELEVGLTGAFLCCQLIGSRMAERGHGVILNIASDLGVIAPDQRIYRRPDIPDEQQPVKPVTYSVVKHGLIGLTRYLATYWADRGMRVNALSPGGVYTGQDEEFVTRLTNLIPLGRMARQDEYRAAVVFLVSDASSYMTGANVVIDGGRTTW